MSIFHVGIVGAIVALSMVSDMGVLPKSLIVPVAAMAAIAYGIASLSQPKFCFVRVPLCAVATACAIATATGSLVLGGLVAILPTVGIIFVFTKFQPVEGLGMEDIKNRRRYPAVARNYHRLKAREERINV